MSQFPTFHGSLTALITPFRQTDVDEEAFARFIEWQIEQGTDGLVPCGSTGEAQTLSHEEHRALNAQCVKVANGRVPVIAGCGSNSTSEAISLTTHAEKIGADAALVVVPYYNKPTQEGVYAHFKAVHDSTSLPIFVYNVPGRTITDISLETLSRLRELPRIVGIKDATADLSRPTRYRRTLGADFIQLSGEDATIVAYLAHGGHGCISVSANVVPKLLGDMHDAWQTKDFDKVSSINDRLTALHDVLFVETSPAPVKYAASLLGFCEDALRLPLVHVSEKHHSAINEALREAGVL